MPVAYREVSIGEAAQSACSYQIIRSFFQAGRPALLLEGVDDRVAAEALTGKFCYVERRRLELAREPGDLLYVDLTGAEVLDAQGVILGRVLGLYDNGANTVAEIRDPGGRRGLDVPLVSSYVDFKLTLPGRLVLSVPAVVFDEVWYPCDATP